jgi:hypothetical protein
MSDRKQPTPIDATEYDRFVEFVRDAHGGTRGHLREEIQIALRERRESYYDGNDRLLRIENELAALKTMLAETDADGNPLPDFSIDEVRARAEPADAHYDPHGTAPDEKPAANQPRGQKVRWLVQKTREKMDNERARRGDLAGIVRDTYGFTDDRIDWYVDQIIDELDAEPDPRNPAKLLAWGDGLKEAREQAHKDAQDDADDEVRRLEQAEPANNGSGD